jgi:hypothetical protein
LDPDPDSKLTFYPNKIIKKEMYTVIMIYKKHIFGSKTLWKVGAGSGSKTSSYGSESGSTDKKNSFGSTTLAVM